MALSQWTVMGRLTALQKILQTILLADDPVAAGSSLARLLNVEPNRIKHIREGARFIGNNQSVVL